MLDPSLFHKNMVRKNIIPFGYDIYSYFSKRVHSSLKEVVKRNI